jgi:hypothetical protein
MARRSRRLGKGACVYCLRVVDRRNRDHVFPSSWYPDNTAQNIEKPQVPCCYNCNNRFSTVENDLLLRFMFCFGWADSRAEGIPNRALRSVDPAQGKNERDRKHRFAKRRRVLREIASASQKPLPSGGTGIVPGFGPEEPGAEQSVVVPFRGESLDRFNEKLVRGFTYVQTDCLIGPTYAIENGLLREDKRASFLEKLHGSTCSYGPGIAVTTGPRDASDPVVAGMEFRIWNRLSLYSVVSPATSTADAWDAAMARS